MLSNYYKGNTFLILEDESLLNYKKPPAPTEQLTSPRLVVVRVNVEFDIDEKSLRWGEYGAKAMALYKALYQTGFQKEIQRRTNMECLDVNLERDERIARYYLSSKHGYGHIGMQRIRDSILPNVVNLFTREFNIMLDFADSPSKIRQYPWLVSIEGEIPPRRNERLVGSDRVRRLKWSNPMNKAA